MSHEELRLWAARLKARGERRSGEDRREQNLMRGDPYDRRVVQRRGRNRGRSVLEVPLTPEEDAEVLAFLTQRRTLP